MEVVHSFEFQLKISKILNFVLKKATEIYLFLINFEIKKKILLTIINNFYFDQITEQGKVFWVKKKALNFSSNCIKISGPGCLHMVDERLKGLSRLKAHLPSCWGPIPRPCAGGAGLPPCRWEDRCRLTIISNGRGWNLGDVAAEKQVILFNRTTFFSRENQCR